MFIVFHDLSLFISVKAFLPSLRVLDISKEREKMIRIESVIRETIVISILLNNLLKCVQGVLFLIQNNFKR